MKIILLSVFLSTLLTSCTVSDVTSAIKLPANKPSVEVSVDVSKTNVRQLSLKDERIADSISNVNLLLAILFLLGWMLPTPTEIFKRG